MNNKALGQIAFEAYCKSVGGHTHDGKPIPGWDDLTPAIRNAWEASALAVYTETYPRNQAVSMGYSVEQTQINVTGGVQSVK